jgi:hypothetical protein
LHDASGRQSIQSASNINILNQESGENNPNNNSGGGDEADPNNGSGQIKINNKISNKN